MKFAKPYPYLYRDKSRGGRWRLRALGRPTITIRGEYGSPEFAANYRAAMEGKDKQTPRDVTKHGTMAALTHSYLRSAAFAVLASTTQRSRRYWAERFVTKFGPLPVTDLERRHVKTILDALASTPGAARNVLSLLRVLMALAIEEGMRENDPTTGVKRPKLSKDGWHTWNEAEIAQYEAKHAIGFPARLAFALALYTGQRSSDLVRTGRQHVSDGKISVVQQKTGNRLWIPLHPDLLAIMDATPSEHLTFIVTEHGKPYAHAQSFGNRLRRWARETGLTRCPLHGLRKACCRRLAEAGCTASEIMAIVDG
jgi:integrase